VAGSSSTLRTRFPRTGLPVLLAATLLGAGCGGDDESERLEELRNLPTIGETVPQSGGDRKAGLPPKEVVSGTGGGAIPPKKIPEAPSPVE
jgi:hypothetical protein